VADEYLKLLDRNDALGAWAKVGEQIKRTTSKAEWMARIRAWLEVKGGAASERDLAAERIMTPEEVRSMSPESTVTGPVYAFFYISAYPLGRFLEDLYINRDCDGILRVGGHQHQPAR
jgi:hypothetical protein